MFNIMSFNIPERATMVNRFSGAHMVNHRSTIAEHTFEVSYYALLVIDKWSQQIPSLKSLKSEVLQLALLHDVPEIYTGDLPYPVKKAHPDVKAMFSKLEQTFMDETLPDYSNQGYHVYSEFIVKYCDTLAVAREIIEEIEIGNKYFISFYHNINIIFSTLYDKPEYQNQDDWEELKYISKQLLDELGINKYVEIPTVD